MSYESKISFQYERPNSDALRLQQELEDKYVMHTFARKPVEFIHGEGVYLYDSEKRKYLDFIGGIGACSLGHSNEILEIALIKQVERLVHVSNYYYIEQRGQLARLISYLLNNECKTPRVSVDISDMEGLYTESCSVPKHHAFLDKISDEFNKIQHYSRPPIWQSFFANSGAEANECAIKLARLYARRAWVAEGNVPEKSPRTIVVLEHSFHGRTLATLAATAQPVKQEWFNPLDPAFVTTPINDVEALERLFEEQGDQICAVLFEPIQGESGVHPCTLDFMRAIRTLTQKHNALMMCDEVQCGCYRTGQPFAFHHYGVVPDVVTMAKGIGGGVPCGVCSAREEVAAAFEPGDHGSTFGGSNLAIAAMFTVLKELSGYKANDSKCQDDIVDENGYTGVWYQMNALKAGEDKEYGRHARSIGHYMHGKLSCIDHRRKTFSDIRGLGMMMAVDLSDEVNATAPEIVQASLEIYEPIVINATGPRTLRFLPPLICSYDEVDMLQTSLYRAICKAEDKNMEAQK